MKTIKLIAVGIILLVSSSMQAQVSVNVNIGTAPSWGPAGYSNIDYYYLPDVQAYYDIRASQFIYFGHGRWVRSRYLPRQYRNYDLNRGYKVVLHDYHGHRPYRNFHNDRKRYYVGYRGEYQRTVGQRYNDRRYAQRRYADNHRYAKNRRYDNNNRKYDNHKKHKNHKYSHREANRKGNGSGRGNGNRRD